MKKHLDHDIPPLLLERARHGELDEERIQRLLERVKLSREEFDLRVEALAAEDAVILEQHPTQEMAPKIRLALEARAREAGASRSPTRTRPSAGRPWIWGLGGAVAATAATALVLQGGWLSETTEPTPGIDPMVIDAHHAGGDPEIEITRLKGLQPELQIWRQADPPERLKENAIATQGDNLQIKYQAGTAKHGVIFSVDGRGSVTLHFPSSDRADTTLERGVHALEYGYELDDAPRFEKFLFVTSTQPLDVASLLEQAERKAKANPSHELTLELSSEQDQATFVVRKPEPTGGRP